MQLPPPDLAQEDRDPDFNWDQHIPVSIRTRAAVACLQLALHQFGTLGQPLWPTPPTPLRGQGPATTGPGARRSVSPGQ